MDERLVTRAEFDQLATIVREFISVFRLHVHQLHDADGGGDTRSPDSYSLDDLEPITARLDGLLSPAPQSGEAE